MFATSSRQKNTGSGGRVGGVAAVGGVADLFEQADDERRAERLAVRGGGDVDRVGRGGELVWVEVRVGGGAAGGVGVVEREHAGGGGEDRGALALVGARDPEQHVDTRPGAPASREDVAGLSKLVLAEHPASTCSIPAPLWWAA